MNLAALQNENQALRRELSEWKDKYQNLLNFTRSIITRAGLVNEHFEQARRACLELPTNPQILDAPHGAIENAMQELKQTAPPVLQSEAETKPKIKPGRAAVADIVIERARELIQSGKSYIYTARLLRVDESTLRKRIKLKKAAEADSADAGLKDK
jgi:hypothetical protein